MKDFKILKFLDKFKPGFEKLEIDYLAMRKVLQVKLLLDGRRMPTVFGNEKKKDDKDDSNKFLKSLWIYIIMGLTMIPFVIMKSSYIYQMSIVFGVIMFFIMSSLISDFSSVLLDVRDRNIIGTKPIGPKTLSTAKTIHIAIYMVYITGALVGPALLTSLYTQGIIFFLVFFVTTILMDMFIIALTSLIYFLILRFFDGEKLKDLINYMQIILTIVISVGYQLVGRLFGVVDLKIEFTPKWWQYFIPPVWFSAPFEMIKKSEVNSTYAVLTVMAIAIPIIAILVYMKLMPIFEENLLKLSNNYGAVKKAKGKSLQLLSKLLCRSKDERIFFRFASDMMKNEREFKLKVYPTLGFSIIFPFIFIFQRLSSESLREISKGRSYFFIYFCGMMIPTLIMMIKYSERYKGAWIYKALPVNSMVPIFKGTIKAFLIKLFIPMFIIQGIIFVAIFGVRIVPDILVVFLNMMIFNITCFMVMGKSLPFSEPFEAAQQSSGAASIALIAVLGVLAVIHLFIGKLDKGVYILLALGFIANLVLWKIGFKISPKKINKN